MKKLSKFVSVLAAAAVAVSAMVSAAGAASNDENLLANPDASNGFKGWKSTGKAWTTAKAYNDIEANDGKFFMPKKVKLKKGESTSVYQDIPLKNCAGKKAELQGYICTADGRKGDHVRISVEFLDKDGKTLGSSSTGSNWADSWKSCAVDTEVPEGAVTARVSLSVKYNSGDYADGCFDDISFTIEGVKRADLVPVKKSDTDKEKSRQK